jgi:hypothetical protein
LPSAALADVGRAAAAPPIYLATPRSPADATPRPQRSADNGAFWVDPAPMAATSALGGARLVEVPNHAAPGSHARPRYALGFRSDAMRGWLNGLGLDATSCLAPMVRLRSKISSDGDVSGSIWLYARCSLR